MTFRGTKHLEVPDVETQKNMVNTCQYVEMPPNPINELSRRGHEKNGWYLRCFKIL